MSAPQMSTTEDIVANADYHTQLLSSIADLEYANSALKQHSSYLSDLEQQLSASEQKITELAKQTKKERKEHERLRDSTARRLAAKLTGQKGKFEAREGKEEREYVEALQNEMVERDQSNMLNHLLAEALTAKDDLEQKAKKYESLQKELHSLYGRVFDGPSGAYPEEDSLEYDVHEAARRHGEAQHTLNIESQAAELLARSCVIMDRCQASVQEALSYSRYDMMGGGNMADYMERNALTNAEACAAQVEALVDQAIRICPTVQRVGRVNIATGSLMSDVFFDNFFTDMAFNKKIQNSAAQVLLANNRLRVERDSAVRRADAAGSALVDIAKDLEHKRRELFNLRRAIFESVAAQVPKPPSYETTVQNPPPTLPTSPPPPFPSPSISPNISTTNSQNRIIEAQSDVGIPENDGASSPQSWGSRNPYAAALAARTRSMSQSP
ncbi:hypothetical protein FA15DRAFT_664449 [Coprinopsis marcescibilis]|uniref:Uncharacterized protein n=1 Tax=Coprinopsis marcescibilis TaxID=230819 RepID=A0A5C3L9G4_COPMA|nr:hypothetical protein FA15DRAFT_664449 [Coprinopsis marcescibilis]